MHRPDKESKSRQQKKPALLINSSGVGQKIIQKLPSSLCMRTSTFGALLIGSHCCWRRREITLFSAQLTASRRIYSVQATHCTLCTCERRAWLMALCRSSSPSADIIRHVFILALGATRDCVSKRLCGDYPRARDFYSLCGEERCCFWCGSRFSHNLQDFPSFFFARLAAY